MPSDTLANIARHMAHRSLAVLVLIAAGTASLRPGKAQDLPADPECLGVSQASAATYTISNTACPDLSVIAAIELADAGNLARCFVKKIRTQISIASEGAAPVVNYQCVEGAQGCTAEIVRDMFPECHAG